MSEEGVEPLATTARSVKTVQEMLKKEIASSVETAGSVDTDQEMLKEEILSLMATADFLEIGHEMLKDEVRPLTATVKNVETAQEMVGGKAESLTAYPSILFANYEYLILIPDKYCYNHNSRIVVPNTETETVFPGYIYSEYSFPPSETNVKIACTSLILRFSFRSSLNLHFS
ncbi:hypothetical protein KIN20_000306 [Parelaphostrongylus tenuis]|uniref:Uncharacterized protein n=1 Tax=Parelaphostrongylus tenuis TaxID=148309 RepID=A0AAD5MB49_PARTN|nr:hypothetical protein KIN20_000306 [Parelaphostrongylus tenuis]